VSDSQRRTTRTGGRDAIEGVIRGRYSLSVGNPETPTPPGWKWTLLRDVARLESGHTPSRKKPEYWDGDIPWIGIRDATGNHGRTLQDTQQHTNQLGIDNSSARVLPANTVCLSRTASVGYVVVMGVPMATSQDFVNWVCSPELDHRFLKYVLLAEHETYLSFASGTTHQTIYYPEVKAFHVCLPSIEEQRRIADVLQAIDDLIDNNRRRVEVLEEMARSIYSATFGMESLQAEWDEGTVGDLIWLQRGFDLPVSSRVEGAVPIIAASGINGSHIEPMVTGPGVVTGRSGSVGKTYYVQGEFWPLNTTLWVKEFRRSSPRHAYFFLQSLDLLGLAGGATMPMLNRNVVHALPVALPPRDVIEEFEERTDAIFATKHVLEAAIAGLTRVRDSLLPKLVTGQIDVSNLDLDAVVEKAAV